MNPNTDNLTSNKVHLVRWINLNGNLKVLEVWDDFEKAEERAEKYTANMKDGIINKIKYAGSIVNVQTFDVRS